MTSLKTVFQNRQKPSSLPFLPLYSWIPIKLVISLHLLSWKKTPNDAVTPKRQSQFTPKMKANAVPRLLSSLVWIDQYSERNGMTSFMEFMNWIWYQNPVLVEQCYSIIMYDCQVKIMYLASTCPGQCHRYLQTLTKKDRRTVNFRKYLVFFGIILCAFMWVLVEKYCPCDGLLVLIIIDYRWHITCSLKTINLDHFISYSFSP